jgi:hypothetical protein
MKIKFADCKFLANIQDKCINLSIIGLLIFSILSVARIYVNGNASAQLLSIDLSTNRAAIGHTQYAAFGQTKTIVLSPSHAKTQTLAVIHLSLPISSEMKGLSPVALSTAQCLVIPGAAMTFREICPNRNNATTPPQQPPIPVNPPLIPPTNKATIPTTNNTNILRSIQNSHGLTVSSLPGPSSALSPKIFKSYNNVLYGVNIQYPSSWRVEEGDNFLFGSAVTNVHPS